MHRHARAVADNAPWVVSIITADAATHCLKELESLYSAPCCCCAAAAAASPAAVGGCGSITTPPPLLPLKLY